MLLKDTVQILLSKTDDYDKKEKKDTSTSYIFNQVIGRNITKNISYASTLPTVQFLTDSKDQKKRFWLVGPDVRGKKFCKY